MNSKTITVTSNDTCGGC